MWSKDINNAELREIATDAIRTCVNGTGASFNIRKLWAMIGLIFVLNHRITLDISGLRDWDFIETWRNITYPPHPNGDQSIPDNKVHGAILGPIWGRQTQVGPMLAAWTLLFGIHFSIFYSHRNWSILNNPGLGYTAAQIIVDPWNVSLNEICTDNI